MPRYYGDNVESMTAALAEIRELGSRFLVGGRADTTGSFRCLEQLAIPEACRDLFTPITEGEFRVDISSTELRAAHNC
jgi:hypothetical protein